ncbi:hypothetical protein J6TS2_39600 [Heyndrickxia sporothermodurans]|nr:hypothetical protein J6TS2_39600 [Heyndrickxia sporothermodurans]
MNSNIFLPRFEVVTVTLMEEVEEKLCIHVERSVEPYTCPICHTENPDYWIQKIKHLKMFERQTLLFYIIMALFFFVGLDNSNKSI